MQHAAGHLSHGASGFLETTVAHEAEALGLALWVAHDLGGRDGAEGQELGTQLGVVDLIHQILDVQVHALELLPSIPPCLVKPAATSPVRAVLEICHAEYGQIRKVKPSPLQNLTTSDACLCSVCNGVCQAAA